MGLTDPSYTCAIGSDGTSASSGGMACGCAIATCGTFRITNCAIVARFVICRITKRAIAARFVTIQKTTCAIHDDGTSSRPAAFRGSTAEALPSPQVALYMCQPKKTTCAIRDDGTCSGGRDEAAEAAEGQCAPMECAIGVDGTRQQLDNGH